MLECVEKYALIDGYELGLQVGEMLNIKPNEIWSALHHISYGNLDFWNYTDFKWSIEDKLIEDYAPIEIGYDNFDINAIKAIDDKSKIYIELYKLVEKGELPNKFILMKNW